MRKKKIKTGQYVLASVLCALAILFVMPVLLVLIASFTSEASLAANGFTFIPEEWSLSAWKYIFNMGDQLLVSYGVTIFVTVVGTLSGLLIQSMFAYTLSRKGFKLKGFLSIMLLITMLFNGGQLSNYMINSSVYHLKNTLLILCIPSVQAMTVIMMRTYIQSNITDALIESAKIDGAKEFRIYCQICMPLMVPMLAALGFMSAISFWNDWQKSYMYITSANKMPLQLLLIRIEKNIEILTSGRISSEAAYALASQIPKESTRMAMLFTVLGPIMIAYPFFQKYFIKGLTLGAVKG
jgi:putative aldouronate transport system permease protein